MGLGDGGSNEEKRAITHEMIACIFAETKRPGMKWGELAAALEVKYEIAKSTAYRVCGPEGYAGKAWLDEVAGVVALRKGPKP